LKVPKAGMIGLVVADQMLRGAQWVDGNLVEASVPIQNGELKKNLKQMLSASPFVGKDVVIGLEGQDVLVESLVVPPGTQKSARAVSAERLKGDPLFNAERAALGVAVVPAPSGSGPSMVIHAAVVHERITQVMDVCRELQLQVEVIEASALASWRAWPGSGMQVRLVRTEASDIVLAGVDNKLLFCRIVHTPISHVELRATISRAASLLSADNFDALTCSGIEAQELNQMAAALGMKVLAPANKVTDAPAVGLATEGPVLTDFLPPEERSLRANRKLRRVRLLMSAATAVLVLCAGLLGYQRIGSLEQRHDMLQEQIRQNQAADLQLAQGQAELIREETNVAHLSSAHPGHRMSQLFSIIANSAPQDVLLEVIKINDELDPDRTSSDEFVVPRRLVGKLHGLAGSNSAVRAFSDALLATDAFSDVRIDASERVILSNGEGGERFRIFAVAETR
jgi:Tfp pilus assembly protein PilN